MTVEQYRPKRLDDALDRIIEECSEVIKVACKANRFGLHSVHRTKGKKNIDLLIEELADIEEAKCDFFRILQECMPTQENTNDKR